MLPIMAMAQSGTVYPIDLSVMMTPPYGPCLKEYVGSDRINIQALLKDFTKNSDQFVVELKVTDNRNRVVLLTHFGDYDFPAGKTFTYPMGPNSTSAQKSNVLHDLFNNAKIKPKDECFEEGAYTFVFQAFDSHSYGSRKVALSMPFTYPVFLQGNTVQPLQIYPYEHEVICNHAFEYTAKNGIKKIATQLGGIAYQWQSANPTGMRVGYHVQVVDLGEIAGRTKENIESAAQSSFGITDKYILDRRTYTPFCNHDFTAANYVEDHAYAWRVMAVTGDALDKEASFTDKNAPVRVFYFCGAPGIEKDDYVVVKDERKFDKDLAKVKMDTIKSADLNALAMWRDSSVKDAYCGVNVEIRKKGQDKWTPYFVEKTADFVAGKEPTDNNFNFENLSYNTHYEVRAQYVKCDNCSDRTENCVYAPYSDIMEFVIDQPIDSAVCGDNLPKLADCGEGSEIPKVVAGDIIIANGTEVVVDSVSYPNASDSSIISGTAHLCMPMIKNIQLKMEFEEIQINCAKELVMGRIKSVWDETTCAMIDLDEAGGQNSTGGKDNPSSDATVEPYDPATASSKPSGTLMVDGDKNVMFRTDKDGEVVTIGKFVSFTSSEYQSTNYLADNTHYVEFYNEDKVNNAFDNDQQGYYRNITNEYEYFDTPHTNVVLPWLANNPGKQKIIKAREVKKKSTSASFESVLFVIPCESGYIQLETTQDENGNYELNIPGLADVASSTPIYAIARTSDETPYFDAGKMMQANYAERTHKLIIVSLIGDLDASYKTEAEKALNSIYGRVGVSWTVELSKFDNDSIKNEILKDGLSIAADDESCWKKETKEMRAIRKLYSESNEIEDNTAYLFVVNRAQEDNFKDTEGDMPRGQAVGYIFKDKVNDAPKFGRLVAHEIGHGVYKLQHTFDYDGLADKKEQTDNIMDYNNGDFLAHYQWRVMQDSVMFVWGLLQDDEDGMQKDVEKELNKKFRQVIEIIFNEEKSFGKNIVFYNCRRIDEYQNSEKDEKNKDIQPVDKALVDGIVLHLSSKQDVTINIKYVPGVIKYDDAIIESLNFDNVIKNATPIKESFEIEGLFSETCDYRMRFFILYLGNDGEIYFCDLGDVINDQIVNAYESNDEDAGLLLAQHVKSNWLNCSHPQKNSDENIDEDQIKSLLNSIVQQFRPNQGVEYSANGKNYRLNNDGELVESNLTNENIDNGIFDSEYNQETELYRFYRNSDGVFQLSAYGLNQETKAFDEQKEVDLLDVSQNYKDKVNSFLVHHDVKNEEQKLTEELKSNQFADGDNVKIKDDTPFFKFLSEAAGVQYTLITTGEIEPQVYYSDVSSLGKDNETNPIHVPAPATGIVEAGVEEVTSITSTVKYVVDIVVDEEARKSAAESFNGLSEITEEGVYSGISDFIIEAGSGLDGSQKEELTSPNTDEGRKNHLTVKIGTHVALVATQVALSGGASLCKDLTKTLGKKATRTVAYKAAKSGVEKTLRNKVKELMKENRKCFIQGAVVEALIYSICWKLTSNPNEEFPLADLLADILTAGVDNCIDDTNEDHAAAHAIISCISNMNEQNWCDMLCGDGKFADDYNGPDKKTLTNLLTEESINCAIGASSDFLLRKVLKWVGNGNLKKLFPNVEVKLMYNYLQHVIKAIKNKKIKLEDIAKIKDERVLENLLSYGDNFVDDFLTISKMINNGFNIETFVKKANMDRLIKIYKEKPGSYFYKIANLRDPELSILMMDELTFLLKKSNPSETNNILAKWFDDSFFKKYDDLLDDPSCKFAFESNPNLQKYIKYAGGTAEFVITNLDKTLQFVFKNDLTKAGTESFVIKILSSFVMNEYTKIE